MDKKKNREKNALTNIDFCLVSHDSVSHVDSWKKKKNNELKKWYHSNPRVFQFHRPKGTSIALKLPFCFTNILAHIFTKL